MIARRILRRIVNWGRNEMTVTSRALLLIGVMFLTGCGSSSEVAGAFEGEPRLAVSQQTLDAALNCTPFENPDKPPVLMVHGTFVTGTEEYTLFYAPQLVALGYDVCIVTYPNRGLGDMQVSAEYVVHALRSIHADTGRKVAIIGHSQGALMPRWAIRFFASARNAVSDYVALAGPHHGTLIAGPVQLGPLLFDDLGLSVLPGLGLPEALYQFLPDSQFISALNAGDETPGDIAYTNLYTRFDELVQPVNPPTAALDFEQGNPRVGNFLLQDLCPAHIAEHVTIGTTDTLAFAMALDAISHPGPADFERAGGQSLCALLPLDLASLVMPLRASNLLSLVASTVRDPMLNLSLAAEEPPLRDYAQ